jgi:2-C-methyl-D-erythritol 4-phosphate cytidylyltransferase
MPNFKTAAVLVCAGSGSRMKGVCQDKLMLEFSGKPIVVHTIGAYDRAEEIDLIVLVAKEEKIPFYQQFKAMYNIEKEIMVVAGGATRMESVLNGAKLVPEGYDFIAIGDGARPMIRPQEIDATIREAYQSGAAALGVYITDTVKRVADGKILETLPREELVGIQTPQVFRRNEYLKTATMAMQSGASFTDDASIYEYYKKPVSFVEGRRDNLKITAPEDILLMRGLMEEQ